jgi:hypothetical protein
MVKRRHHVCPRVFSPDPDQRVLAGPSTAVVSVSLATVRLALHVSVGAEAFSFRYVTRQVGPTHTLTDGTHLVEISTT